MKVCCALLFSFLSSTMLFGATQNADSSSFYLANALKLAKANRFGEAERNFAKAIEFDSAAVPVRLAYGSFLEAQHKYFVAVEQYGKVLEADLEQPIALRKLADISFLLRRWNDVLAFGNKLMTTQPSARLNYMLAKTYYELENYGQSKKNLEAALKLEPKYSDAVVLLGKVLIDLGEYSEAIEVYNQSLALNPKDAKLTYELGLLYYAQNNEKEAIYYFELAASQGLKKDMGFYENLGLAYLGVDIEKGVETLNLVLENKPGNAAILFQIAQAYFKAGSYTKAADAYYTVYENDPSNTRALFMTGIAVQKGGDKNKGVSLCEQAIKLDPGLAQFKTAKAIF